MKPTVRCKPTVGFSCFRLAALVAIRVPKFFETLLRRSRRGAFKGVRPRRLRRGAIILSYCKHPLSGGFRKRGFGTVHDTASNARGIASNTACGIAHKTTTFSITRGTAYDTARREREVETVFSRSRASPLADQGKSPVLQKASQRGNDIAPRCTSGLLEISQAHACASVLAEIALDDHGSHLVVESSSPVRGNDGKQQLVLSEKVIVLHRAPPGWLGIPRQSRGRARTSIAHRACCL